MAITITVNVEGKGELPLPAGSTAREALGSDADGAVAALVDGTKPVDLSRALGTDCALKPIFPD